MHNLTQLPDQNNLRNYQKALVEKCLNEDYWGLFCEPGTGKTVTMLTAIAERIKRGQIKKTLIVSTPRIIASVWKQEASQWQHTQHLTFSSLSVPPKKREAALNADVDIILCTFDGLEWLVKHPIAFDCIIIDESSALKNFQSKRTQRAIHLGKKVKYRYILTGSPKPNGTFLDVFPQMRFLTAGNVEPWSWPYGTFLNKCYTPNGYKWIAQKGVDAVLTKLVARHATSLTAKDHIDLPALTEINVFCTMPPEAWHIYHELAKILLVELGEAELSAANGAVKVAKLKQITSGSCYDENGNVLAIHDDKLTACIELVDSITTPVLIFYHYAHELTRLKAAFPHASTLNSLNAVDRWNNDLIPILLVQVRSGSHGLNLQLGSAQHIIYFGLDYSYEIYQQGVARLHRSGQKKPIFVHRLLVENSIDTVVADRLSRKEMSQAELMAALKLSLKATVMETDVVDELATKRKELRKKMQQQHPDKGGNAEIFAALKKEFDALRA